jgi:hypothetical protein
MEIDPFVDAYLEAAIWTSTVDGQGDGDNPEPMDAYFGVGDIHLETLAEMIADCAKFVDANGDDLARFYKATETGPSQGGHDFWLTRNGHGAGFWDRGAGEVGDRLTDAAKTFPEFTLWTDGEYVRS